MDVRAKVHAQTCPALPDTAIEEGNSPSCSFAVQAHHSEAGDPNMPEEEYDARDGPYLCGNTSLQNATHVRKECIVCSSKTKHKTSVDEIDLDHAAKRHAASNNEAPLFSLSQQSVFKIDFHLASRDYHLESRQGQQKISAKTARKVLQTGFEDDSTRTKAWRRTRESR